MKLLHASFDFFRGNPHILLTIPPQYWPDLFLFAIRKYLFRNIHLLVRCYLLAQGDNVAKVVAHNVSGAFARLRGFARLVLKDDDVADKGQLRMMLRNHLHQLA